jgi:hypothetical protein
MAAAGDLTPLDPAPSPADKKPLVDIKGLVEKGKGGLINAKDWMEKNKGVTVMGAAGLGIASLVGLMALYKAAKSKGRGGRGKREGRFVRRAIEEDERGLVEGALQDPEFLEFLEEIGLEMEGFEFE